MTTSLKGKTREEAEALFDRFHQMVTGKKNGDADAADLGKLAVFAGVREFPLRVKCATLSWHALRAALHGDAERVTTE
jgi:nitrogen fixation NifU-like protein